MYLDLVAVNPAVGSFCLLLRDRMESDESGQTANVQLSILRFYRIKTCILPAISTCNNNAHYIP